MDTQGTGQGFEAFIQPGYGDNSDFPASWTVPCGNAVPGTNPATGPSPACCGAPRVDRAVGSGRESPAGKIPNGVR